MKLVKYKKPCPETGTDECLGILTDRGIIDVAAECERLGDLMLHDIEDVLQTNSLSIPFLEELAKQAEHFVNAPLAPLFSRPGRLLCIGLNYRRHAKECGLPLPPAPVLFNKFDNALAGPGDCITLPPEYKEYDYEAELVLVIGKAARNVPEEEALDYVFGYTCGNDLSTRDLQFARGGQWLLSKTFDGFAPVGPCLVTADSLDPNDLAISSAVNGETRQDSRTSDMIFSPAQIIADLSRHFTLRPGDLIFTGTPQGVMHGYPADQKSWLKPGDRVTVTIEGIGTLENTFC